VVSSHRVFDTRRFTVDEFERIRRLVPGATLDDAVLAVCADGLRRYLDSHGELPESDLTALVAASQELPKAAWPRLHLGTTLADPVQRLALIHAQNAAAAPAASTRRDDTRQLDTFILTRVPGPRLPLYLGGARMTYFSAILPIADGQGLAFAVTRYDGRIVISPTSCRELMPDPQAFTQCIRDSFQELLAITEGAAPAPLRSAAPRASASGTDGPAARKARTAASAPRAATSGRRRSTAPRR
jgi:hypothetical protein